MSQSEELLKTITDRQIEIKKMSNYLTQLESQLALIFAASPDMIMFLHMDGTIIKVSQAVWRILGYSRDEMTGKSMWDYIHPDDMEATRAIRTRLTLDKFLYFDSKDYFTNRWLKKDGSYAKLSWRFSIYDEREDHTIGFATDVTNLALENPFNFGLLHRAINMTKDGVVITDSLLENNPIIYVNPAFCKNCGYTNDELVGNNCRVLQSDDKDQAALKTIREAVANGESCEVLLKNFKKDKTVFFNHVLVSPVVECGMVTNYIGISRDLTDLINEGVYKWDRLAPRGFGKLGNK